MNDFAILDSAGRVVRSGSCPPEEMDAQVGPGESLHVGVAPLGARFDAQKQSFVTEASTPVGTPVPPASVSEARAAAYPPIADQLDDLWHAMDAGTLPRAEPFYSRIQAVKKAHPKE